MVWMGNSKSWTDDPCTMSIMIKGDWPCANKSLNLYFTMTINKRIHFITIIWRIKIVSFLCLFQKWLKADLNGKFKLPMKNEFIPTNFEIYPLEKDSPSAPTLIKVCFAETRIVQVTLWATLIEYLIVSQTCKHRVIWLFFVPFFFFRTLQWAKFGSNRMTSFSCPRLV